MTKFLELMLLFDMVLVVSTGAASAVEQPDWGVNRIRATLVWQMNTGTGISIAIIDSGVWKVHPDLTGRVIDPTISFIDGNPDIDLSNHGTLIAGVIAAVVNNFGLIGVSPSVSLYVAQAYYTSDPQDIVDALYWADSRGAQIIVIGFDISTDFPGMRNACDYLYYNHNRLLIAPAGNDGVPVAYPAKYDSVIAVGAVDQNDNRPSWSNYGPELELVAPGVNINSTAYPDVSPFQYYIQKTGTSFAAPHVAGVAALIYASKMDPDYDIVKNDPYPPAWDALEVRKKLQDTAFDRGSPGRDNYYGYGLVNAWYAGQSPRGNINYDSTVNILDAIVVTNAFGSTPGSPNWDPHADIIINNVVNVYDVIVVSVNFGKDP